MDVVAQDHDREALQNALASRFADAERDCRHALRERPGDPDALHLLGLIAAGDLPRLAAFRATLRRRVAESPLVDARRFARGLEDAYRQMWHEWCSVGRIHSSQTSHRSEFR